MKSSSHGIITPQFVDKMQSNNTFLETRIHRLLVGLISFEKGLVIVFVTFLYGVLGQVWYVIVSYPDLCLFLNFDAHVQCMLEMSRCLYSGGNFSKMF